MLQILFEMEEAKCDPRLMITVSRGVLVEGHLFLIYISHTSWNGKSCEVVHLHATNPNFPSKRVMWLNGIIPTDSDWLWPDLGVDQKLAALLAEQTTQLDNRLEEILAAQPTS